MKEGNRRLRLNRETIRELDDTRLQDVKGAIPPWTPVIWTLPVNNCVVLVVSGNTCP